MFRGKDRASFGVPGSGVVTSVDGAAGAVVLSGLYSALLTPTAPKTAATYNAVARDFIPCDTTSNSITVTLPTAPANGTLIGVKHVIQAGTNTVTIACGGSDVFNKAAGATSATLPNLAESYIFQYKSSSAIWYIVEHDSPRTAQYFESLAALSPTSLIALQTQSALQAAKQDARAIADLGFFCRSSAGCLLTPNVTPTKLDMAAGSPFMGTTELNVAAQAAISTTIASLADATNPKWVSVELNPSAVVVFNQGTAAAAPAFPTLNTANLPLGFLFVPANATNVDTLLSAGSTPTNAKLIDARNIRTVHDARVLATDIGNGTATLNATPASILTATVPLPANSPSLRDTYVIEGSGLFKSTTTATTLQLLIIAGAQNLTNITTASLTSSASTRVVNFRCVVTVLAIGASAQFLCKSDLEYTAPLGALTVERFINARLQVAFDSTTAQVFDVKAAVASVGGTQNFQIEQFSITKIPA